MTQFFFNLLLTFGSKSKNQWPFGWKKGHWFWILRQILAKNLIFWGHFWWKKSHISMISENKIFKHCALCVSLMDKNLAAHDKGQSLNCYIWHSLLTDDSSYYHGVLLPSRMNSWRTIIISMNSNQLLLCDKQKNSGHY